MPETSAFRPVFFMVPSFPHKPLETTFANLFPPEILILQLADYPFMGYLLIYIVIFSAPNNQFLSAWGQLPFH